MLDSVQMDAVLFAGDNDRPCVEERQMMPAGGQSVVMGELPGFLLRSSKHLVELGQGGHRGRRDEQDPGVRAICRVGEPVRELRQLRRALRDI